MAYPFALLAWIVPFALAGSVLSMAGGVFLLWRADFARRFPYFLISLAAGVLLAVAFFDLLPEATEILGSQLSGFLVVGAIIVFFAVERGMWWYHHHRYPFADLHEHKHPVRKTHAYLLLMGDTIHNFIDGILITAAFFADISLGIAVSVGVIAHEVPQEIADFSVMLNSGFRRMRIFVLNLATSLTTLLGAFVAFFALSVLQNITPFVLAVAAGVFIYIALSDLIPAIHHEDEHRYNFVNIFAIILGAMIIFALGFVPILSR